MNWKKSFGLTLLMAFVVGLLLSSCRDPRANCNHPDHGKYMSEKIAKKRGMPR